MTDKLTHATLHASTHHPKSDSKSFSKKSLVKGLLILALFVLVIAFVQSKTNTINVVDPWHTASEVHTGLSGGKTIQQLFDAKYFAGLHRGSCGGHTAIRGYTASRGLAGCSRIRP
jgi:hypothetical protein